MLIEALKPLTVRLPNGDLQLKPGVPTELPEASALKLLAKAGGKVRLVPRPPDESVTIEPADELVRARPVFWESGGVILGPAIVSDFGMAQGPNGPGIWLCLEYQGEIRWVRDCQLRSKSQYEQHRAIEKQRNGGSEAGACSCCLTARFWESIHGAVVCGTCHPPADAALVRRWLS